MDVVLKALIARIKDLHETCRTDEEVKAESVTWQAIKSLMGFAHGVEAAMPPAIDPDDLDELIDYDAGPDLEDILEIASFHGFDVHFTKSESA